MNKLRLKGFLLAESMVALVLAIMGISVIALIVGASRANERQIELKTDRAYAWHVLKEEDLSKITVHDRVYQPAGAKSVYDTTDKKTYEVKE
ncbi:hypothetical protein PT281_02720 [Lactobacillus sp. ESL0701]|uniref:type II secretion system protein n=1 Tax=Lactobacillus sp. ESL0701 TaxID=2983217 RepID=UPI0023F7A32A|nr:hypothetical protein [Lactobacillus sp. ESL0701]MDF7672200.1 hypothetical protein [Lactobacillus sp. ESL0701]